MNEDKMKGVYDILSLQGTYISYKVQIRFFKKIEEYPQRT